MKNWVQLRLARPTDRFNEVIKFYEEGLGLHRIGGFENHEGYDGVMFGLPDSEVHLEFTQHVHGSPCPAPTKDNLMVFYIPNEKEIEHMKARLQSMGYPEVAPENPYWHRNGVTIEDPDGWRIVLYQSNGI